MEEQGLLGAREGGGKVGTHSTQKQGQREARSPLRRSPLLRLRMPKDRQGEVGTWGNSSALDNGVPSSWRGEDAINPVQQM